MNEDRKVRVLIVDDSEVAIQLLVGVLESDPTIKVVGTAKNGDEAVAAISELAPNVVTMDLHMPKIDGFEVTRRIMETQPVPIVIVTGSENPQDVTTSFRAMEAGAVAILGKPPGPAHPDFMEVSAQLVRTVRLMSEVKVVRRWNRENRPAAVQQPVRAAGEIKLIAIGASTGGPPVLRTILADLPKNFPIPILIVQHISDGFTGGLAAWLADATGQPVRVATHGELLASHSVRIAPERFHMTVEKSGRIVLDREPPEHGMRPSVSKLFRSVAGVFGAGAAGVLLTGMGRDGADDLLLMKKRGAPTFAQDFESSVVNGMPGEAVKLGAAGYVLPPERIAAALASLVKQKSTGDEKLPSP